MKKISCLLFLVGFVVAGAAFGDFKTRLEKPRQDFVLYQFNFAAGFDSREPDDFGLADRGPRTQFSIEWLSKDEKRIQQGYTRFAQPVQWNLKLGLELDPSEVDGEDPGVNLKLFDVWVRFGTKWDRTSFWVGHRSLPYGQNPKLDPVLSFMPNQAPLDLGFGRDTGLFFRTPVSPGLDLDLAVTAGGFLSGPILVARDEGGGFDVEDRIDYRGSWLATVRLGRPNFKPMGLGVFASFGSTHRAEGPLTDITRLGVDWVIKKREDWKMVHQISAGESSGDALGTRFVSHLLSSFEVYLTPKWRLGITHTFEVQDVDAVVGPRRETGSLLGMVSFAVRRSSRLRLHPFTEYHDATGERDSGVLVQFCTGCGWRK